MQNQHTNIDDLRLRLGEKLDLPLKFYFEGGAINPGYHVTEIKFATIKSLDCGRASDLEHWDEITVQLLDGHADSKQDHMPGSKFMGIVGKALETLSEDTAPYLFFEFAPNNGPIRKLSIESIEIGNSELSISLGSEKAMCKPFQRSKAARVVAALGVRTIDKSMSSSSCCSDVNRSDRSACC